MFRLNYIYKREPMSPPPHVITTMSKDEFKTHLEKNKGAVILKFGAEWCGPCKQIETLVYSWMGKMSENVLCASLDIDEESNFDLYAFLKSKRMVNGVPVILCYLQGNVTWIPNTVIVGAHPVEINKLFESCGKL